MLHHIILKRWWWYVSVWRSLSHWSRPACAAVPAGCCRWCTEGSTAGSCPASAGSSASPLCSAPPSSLNTTGEQEDARRWRRKWKCWTVGGIPLCAGVCLVTHYSSRKLDQRINQSDPDTSNWFYLCTTKDWRAAVVNPQQVTAGTCKYVHLGLAQVTSCVCPGTWNTLRAPLIIQMFVFNLTHSNFMFKSVQSTSSFKKKMLSWRRKLRPRVTFPSHKDAVKVQTHRLCDTESTIKWSESICLITELSSFQIHSEGEETKLLNRW